MPHNIPNGLGSIDDLKKRAAKARSNWENWRSILQEAYDYAAPQRDTISMHNPGQRKNRHVFDSTAIDGLVSFANRIQGAIVPSWQRWMSLVAGEAIPKEQRDKIDSDLEFFNDVFFSNLNHSNFSTEIAPALSDLGIGTGAILIEEGEFAKEETLKFTNIPLAELHPEKPARGPVVNVWRPQQIEIRHIKEIWPTAELSDNLAKMAKDNEFQEVEIKNAMLFNPSDGKYWHIVIYEKDNHVLFSQSFDTRRLIVFRWHVTPGEIFGRGPILQKMADIRTLNKVVQFLLENAAIQIAGTYTGVADGIFNPYTARIAPGVILPVSSNASTNPTLQALPRAGDIQLSGIVIENLQQGIKKALLSDPLGEITDPVRTATEQLIRQQEALKDRGASFGRLKSELIEPLVAAVVDILKSRGQMPGVLSVDGKTFTIKQESPLAKSEGLEDFQNQQVWFNSLQGLPPEVVMGSVRIEDIPKEWQEKLGVNPELVRPKEERRELGKAFVQAAQSGIGGGGETIQ
jgi:hypothetical protein